MYFIGKLILGAVVEKLPAILKSHMLRLSLDVPRSFNFSKMAARGHETQNLFWVYMN